MPQRSLLARSGLWRVTRNGYVRRLYQHLEESGVFVAQLDRFERQTTRLDGMTGISHDVTTTVDSVTEQCPERLRGAPLAPSDQIVFAREGEETVGWCCLSDRQMYVPELHRRVSFSGSYLWRLWVRPAERRRGVGTAIIREAVEHSRTALNTGTISALVAPDNVPSRKAFDGLGFTSTERYTSVGVLRREWHGRTVPG